MRVLAVAGDAGGARALTPVIRRLAARGAAVDCRAYAAAAEIWRQENFDLREIFPVEIENFDCALLGTSVTAEQFELEIARRAKASGVFSISVLDFWSNYRERFTAADGEFVLPDAVCVMDGEARREMTILGFPPEILRVTGQPAFDNLKNFHAEPPALSVGEINAKAKILYVSQPLSQLYSREQLGFDEEEVWRDVVGALTDVFERRGRRGVLSLKLHPREAGRIYALPLARSTFLEIITLDAFAAPRRAAFEADLVVGMNSILLLESCFLGKTVVSYQPNLLLPDSLPSNRRGWSRAVYRREALTTALESELFDAAARHWRRQILAGIPKDFDAANHIADLIFDKV